MENEIEDVRELVDRLLANPIFNIARDVIENNVLLKELITLSNKINKKDKELLFKQICNLRDNFSSESTQYIDCVFYVGLLLRYQSDTEKKLRAILNTIAQKGKQIYESKST
jgi:hypothetical protein